MLPLDMG